MKKWQAILASVGIAAGMAATEFVPTTTGKTATQAVLAVLAAAIAKKTSESNPDGSKAFVPLDKK